MNLTWSLLLLRVPTPTIRVDHAHSTQTKYVFLALLKRTVRGAQTEIEFIILKAPREVHNQQEYFSFD